MLACVCGALLSFRGWALHDEKATVSNRQPLPPLVAIIEPFQPRFTHPVIDLDNGFLKRPGFLAKLAWEGPFPLKIDVTHYDNNANPAAVNADREWGWRTQFDNIGAVVDLTGSLQLRTQLLSGRTQMGRYNNGVIWVDSCHACR